MQAAAATYVLGLTEFEGHLAVFPATDLQNEHDVLCCDARARSTLTGISVGTTSVNVPETDLVPQL